MIFIHIKTADLKTIADKYDYLHPKGGVAIDFASHQLLAFFERNDVPYVAFRSNAPEGKITVMPDIGGCFTKALQEHGIAHFCEDPTKPEYRDFYAATQPLLNVFGKVAEKLDREQAIANLPEGVVEYVSNMASNFGIKASVDSVLQELRSKIKSTGVKNPFVRAFVADGLFQISAHTTPIVAVKKGFVILLDHTPGVIHMKKVKELAKAGMVVNESELTLTLRAGSESLHYVACDVHHLHDMVKEFEVLFGL